MHSSIRSNQLLELNFLCTSTISTKKFHVVEHVIFLVVDCSDLKYKVSPEGHPVARSYSAQGVCAFMNHCIC
ncbi:hypothetical protein KC19_6G068100 [Ceratodon purpureus]|uniref:Uncharacterized protein n=1 Tax=Ceratodon purpureus TaxID=3225 RepID=A0A8T0HFS6_CERPU|nr:hypothetical protein KC19_6G068100 [Ceratodon purpureus]